jgi:glycosyltransferase involved in cell wall biosynthesis
MKPLIEVRVPTYKRPQLLQRALQSLIGQSWTNWTCMVYDDSPAMEAEAVVASFRDSRLHYTRNEKKLGGAGNIDRAFFPEPFAGGSFACILEDDNWLYAGFLQKNIEVAQDLGAEIVQRNQAVWIQEKTQAVRTERTTRGAWWEDGFLSPAQLHASLHLFEGISNGGLFWKLNAGIDLVVGSAVTDSGLQEYCRTWQIDRPVFFAKQPECVWVSMGPELVTRSVLDNRSFATGTETVSRVVYRTYGQPSVDSARELAARRGKEIELELNLARVGIPGVALKKPAFVYQWAKAMVRRTITDNPLKDYRF